MSLKLVDGKTMALIDQAATSEYGISSLKLMEAAGYQLAEQIRALPRITSENRIVILAGRGKNGGDGLVCARMLARRGLNVSVALFGNGSWAKEALGNLKRLQAEKVLIKEFGDGFPEPARELINSAEIVVDALLGMGLKGAVREPLASVIRALNLSSAWVVAADLPSGLDADTGKGLDPTVAADLTVTFGLPKQGLLQPWAAPFVGQLVVETINFPAALLTAQPHELQYLDAKTVASQLPIRHADAHKKSASRVLVIGACSAYHGALLLAGLGAQKAGSGFVSLAYPKSLDAIIRMHTVEEICHLLPEIASHALGVASLVSLLKLAKTQTAVVIGPGLGAAKATQDLVRQFIRKVQGPQAVIVDADALVSGLPLQPRHGPRMILTPHAGEAARLLDWTVEQVQADRPAAARAISARYACVSCLKGQFSLIANPAGRVTVVNAGSPALATAGTGDVLAGVIAAGVSEITDAECAAQVGVFLHGWAGQLASPDFFGLGVTAREVANALPEALAQLRMNPGARPRQRA